MTKNNLVIEITNELEREKTEVKQVVVKAIVQKVLDKITDIVIQERRLELRNFGVFTLKLRKARQARNPKNDTVVPVPAHYTITFKPGKLMEEKLKEKDKEL